MAFVVRTCIITVLPEYLCLFHPNNDNIGERFELNAFAFRFFIISTASNLIPVMKKDYFKSEFSITISWNYLKQRVYCLSIKEMTRHTKCSAFAILS